MGRALLLLLGIVASHSCTEVMLLSNAGNQPKYKALERSNFTYSFGKDSHLIVTIL